MKRILITGANSYVGTHVEQWLMKEPDKYIIDTLDMLDPKWRNYDFSGYDVIYHVAGIAHVSSKKSMDDLYYKINRDLAIETAKKSRDSGVKKFIFMSSMIIYGEDNSFGNNEHIDVNKFNPINAYGNSKLEADLKIQELASDSFGVAIIRPPVIYGPKCKGNFPKLISLAYKMPVVPKLQNQRSMIYIDNFAEFIRIIIEQNLEGVFYPQNSEYMSTSNIILVARKKLGKRTWNTAILNLIVKILTKLSGLFRKIYGNKTYDLKVSKIHGFEYNIVSEEDSIRLSM